MVFEWSLKKYKRSGSVGASQEKLKNNIIFFVSPSEETLRGKDEFKGAVKSFLNDKNPDFV